MYIKLREDKNRLQTEILLADYTPRQQVRVLHASQKEGILERY
jgi:hypothetical protein